MTGRKNRALQVHSVVPYKALENFSKALYGTTSGTCRARFFRLVMRLTNFSVGLPRTVRSFVCDFIALEIMESELAFHDDNFWKFHVPCACASDACALETWPRLFKGWITLSTG